MAQAGQPSHRVRFGEFRFDFQTAELQNNGQKLVLQDQPFRVLTVLLESPGRLVTREELKKKLWPSDTFVDFDHGLNKAVNRLRETLDDSADHPRFIETLPRRGYRFIAPVFPDGQKPLADARPGPSHQPSPWKSVAMIVVILLVAIAGSLVGIFRRSLHKYVPNLQAMRIVRLTDIGTAAYVAISPDGRYVVYALREGEKLSLWVRQVTESSGVQILPPAPVDFQGLAFSPDGKYLYFVRSAENSPIYKSLYSMPVLGGPAHLLINDVDCAPSFSPASPQAGQRTRRPAHPGHRDVRPPGRPPV